MAKMTRWTRRVHRLTAYLVGLQVLLWIAGGLTFAWVPFDSVVKGGAVLATKPKTVLPADWRDHLDQAEARIGPVRGLVSHDSAQGPLLKLVAGAGEHWLRLNDGALDSRPTATQVRAFAETLYAGDSEAGAARYLEDTETRVLGLVDEMYGRTGVWQVPFDDGYGTRLYFDGATGRYLTVRNNFWVLYDAMWRLHIMDYDSGDDFNNPLLTVFATLAGVFVLSGLFLVFFALRRLVRDRAG